MKPLVGTGVLVRLALRRDRIMLPSWLAVFVLMAAGSASATVGLYPTLSSRIAAAETFNQADSLVALYGRVYDTGSIGALAMVKLGGIGAIFVAVLAIMITIRHTRAEEEYGRLELVGATVVGRHAGLAAALLVSVGANLLLAVLTAAGLISAGLPASGSVAFGLAWAGVGIAFAAVAAVAAQLTTGARTATGVAVAVLGAVYLLRALGDGADQTGPRWLTWLSPIGWGQQFRPYAGNRWWVLLIIAGFAVVTAAAAFVLNARRDMGAGLLPQRLGPATAAANLRGPLALAWRLHRGTLLSWVAGFVLLGLVFGNIASNVGGFLNSDEMRDVVSKLGGEKGLVDAYLAAMLGMVGVIASGYGVQAAMRLRAEESSLRAEPVLATAVGRGRWLLCHAAIAMAGTTLLMLVVGTTAGLAYGARVGDFGEVGRVLGGALAQAPATWVLSGIVLAGYGLAPRVTAAGWVAFAGFVLLGEFGPLFSLDQWVMDMSPFAHVPRLPGAEWEVLPMAVLTAVAGLLVLAGLGGFRRRDTPVT